MRKLFAILLTIAFIFPLLLAAQVSVSVVSFALNRDFYIRALDADPVYNTLLSDQVINRFVFDHLSLPPDADTRTLEDVLRSVVTKEYLQEQVKAFVDGLFDYLQGASENFEPTMNIEPLKTALAGEKQDEFLRAILAALPVCEPGQLPGFNVEGQSACKPAGIPDELIISELGTTLVAALAFIPDEVPIDYDWQELQERENWRFFRTGAAVPASILLSVLFLCFVAASFWYIGALIVDESWRMRLQWLGWTLMVPAILIFLVGLAVGSSIPNYWVRFGLEQADFSMVPLSAAAPEILRAVIRGALPQVARSFMMVGGISGALSIGLIFWGLTTPRKPREQS